MRFVVSAQEMRNADRKTIEDIGLSARILIEHAASSVYEKLEAEGMVCGSEAVIFCGTGNNGADGLALGRMLTDGGGFVTCVLVGDREKASEENKFELEAARKKKVDIQTIEEFEGSDSHNIRDFDVVVDAIFGVGLSREVSGDYRTAIRTANACRGIKIAMDIPSGISSDDGSVLGIAFRADITYSFAFMKRGLLFYPGREYAGKTVICACGIGDDTLDNGRKTIQLEDRDIPHILPARRDHSHKGTYGRVLVVAGSTYMTGAAAFSGKAAYRAGAGLVKILSAEENLGVLQTILPEALYGSYSDKNTVDEALEWADVILTGPGLGKSEESVSVLRTVIAGAKVPIVIDADALNIISGDMSLLSDLKVKAVLTPHLGEMSRLTGEKVSDIEKDMPGCASSFADRYRVTVLLKSAVSVIAEPDGRAFINTTGCDALSKGGSGDILSGFTAGLLAGDHSDVALSAAAAAYICGKNAEHLTDRMSGRSVMAQDLLEEIGEVLNCYGK